jgi:hypothetical protein
VAQRHSSGRLQSGSAGSDLFRRDAGSGQASDSQNTLTSYAEIAESEHYNWPLSMLLPNVLADFDLPDWYSELNSKNLRQVAPWGAEPAIK